jgi:hypothetical protein
LRLGIGGQQESDMKFKWIAMAGAALVAGLALVAVDPALAAPKKKKIARQCIDQPQTFTWGGIFTNPRPVPNGCSPPVYAYGKYVGQDPDPNIRAQLLRDPQTGYSPFY